MEGIPPDGASSSSSAVRAPPLRDEEIARILNHGREEDADSDDEDEDLVQPVHLPRRAERLFMSEEDTEVPPINAAIGFESAPTSPSQVGVSGLVTPEELSREPTPDLFPPEEQEPQSNQQRLSNNNSQSAQYLFPQRSGVSQSAPGSPGHGLAYSTGSGLVMAGHQITVVTNGAGGEREEKYVVGTTGGNLVSIQEEDVPANVVIHQHSPYYGGGYGGAGGADECGAVGGELVIEDAPADPPHKRARHANMSELEERRAY
ncbi:unnamed protein product [Arctia plantaginis]|uniref:Uncharacterized protein n=1 Tax=Arctia plantaginis TaxID=874455 RepID=A0A8S1B522_ARCPL|nr:unnamed protein product [Arctia plantaginis]